ncbi:kelch repeat protein, partial [Aureobasidium melanogenum]
MDTTKRSNNRYLVRLGAVALIVAATLPFIQKPVPTESNAAPSIGVDSRAVPIERKMVLETRADSPTDVCTRWSHQSAVINGTLYVYGGQATTEPGQTQNKWNNDFLSMDLTNSWQISSPSLTGLPQPSGPPNVSNGFLWNSHESVYLYGGEFSDSPIDAPTTFSLWEYNAISSQWIEHQNPTTSSGDNAQSGDQPVQRVAEGAGASVPGLGRGFYFGGHEDTHTTEGWSNQVARIYIKSLIEFTFPGYQNNQVASLSNNKAAGSDGAWRNVTVDSAGFPERADGLLVYIPGFGDQGILLGLAGGTEDTFTQMNVIDVYDIATSTWYKQATSGPTPKIRVNPCAAVAAAPDGSSYQVHMFGGQNLIPAGNQTQYDDLWILTVPSFTWIQVDQSSQSVPPGRAGHSCQMWDGQMIVVGGYVGDQISCDSPGIYVLNASSLQWSTGSTALSGGSGSDSSASSGTSGGSSNTAAASASGASAAGGTTSPAGSASGNWVSNARTNPFNQQPAQLANGSSPGGLEGSYGYQVPDVVISVIGGNAQGGATVTAPAQTASDGPLKTGSPIIYSTVTSSSTATATGNSGGNSTSGSGNKGSSGPNVGAIVAGVIAGILFVIVCYLAFCAWLYRKRLRLYKRHVEMAQRQALNEKNHPNIPGLIPIGAGSSSGGSGDRRPWTASENASGKGSSNRNNDWGYSEAYRTDTAGQGSVDGFLLRRSSDDSGAPEDLLAGNTPSFWGTVLAPRRSLRVVNRD